VACITTAVLIAAVALLDAKACHAEDFIEPFGYADARLLGMGYSYVGLWGDPNPLYSNPASFGLTRGVLSLSFGTIFGGSGEDMGFRFVSLTDEERDAGAGGFAWGQYKSCEDDNETISNVYNYMVGQGFKDLGSLGVGLRYVRGSEFSGSTLVSSWHGFATDVGVMFRYKVVALGILARDVAKTQLRFSDGTEQKIAPTYSLGLSLRPLKGAVIALDVHELSMGESVSSGAISGGFEGKITPYIALRGGMILEDGFQGGITAYTGGLGLLFGDFELGYACLVSDEQIKKQCISVMRRF
jgi:hypothetical protein